MRDISVVAIFSSVVGSSKSHANFGISEIVPVVILKFGGGQTVEFLHSNFQGHLVIVAR